MPQHATCPDSPREIEAQLDQYRDALPAALEALRQRFSVDGLWSDGASLFNERRTPRDDPASPLAGTLFEAEARWKDEGGPVAELPETARATAMAKPERANTAGLTAGKLGAGAVFAVRLPQSVVENQVLGGPRDLRVGEVRRLLHVEWRRVARSVEQVAQSLAS